MLRFLLFISVGLLLLILQGSSGAKKNESDSLKHLIQRAQEDSSKVKLLNQLSKFLSDSHPDSAINTAIKARNLAEKINYKPGQAKALKNIGIVYYNRGKYIEAIKMYNEAMAIAKSIGDKRGEANLLGNVSSIYYEQGDDAKALEMDLKALRISESINDTFRIASSLTNIGTIYSNKPGTYKKALECLFRAYVLGKAIRDSYTVGLASVNLGEVYYKMNNDSTALLYLKDALISFEGTEDLPFALNMLGKVYKRQKEYANAIKNHEKAFEFSKKLDAQNDMAHSLVCLAEVFLAKSDYSSAIKRFHESLKISIPLKATSQIKDAYEGLTIGYSNIHDYSNAFKYQNLLLAIKDTIYNINTDKKLGTLQFNFDLEKKESEINLLTKDKEIQTQEIQRQKLVRNGFIGGFAVVLLFAGVVFMQRNRISKEKKRSDELLMNILPEETAEELKATGAAKVKSYDSVSVLFTDFKNFTQASEKLTPEELVAEINLCFSEFDRIVTRHGIEKIKTIGDAYMCAGGIPMANTTHPYNAIEAGFEMIAFIEKNKQDKIARGLPFFEIRLGIHTGPVVAGIVGIKKFAYDIWGDAVNTASRMESSGVPGKVNISHDTYELVKDRFKCIHRGKVEAKNKGHIDMYFVEGWL